MRVVDLRGRGVTWSFKGCTVLGDDAVKRSGPHLRARPMIRAAFPGEVVYEEVPVPGGRLRMDFVVPARRVVVEVQGKQHTTYTPGWHKSKSDFVASLKRDRLKREWCERNNLRLIELPDGEDDDAWRRRLDGQGED